MTMVLPHMPKLNAMAQRGRRNEWVTDYYRPVNHHQRLPAVAVCPTSIHAGNTCSNLVINVKRLNCFCSVKLKFNGTVFLVASSRGCHEDATRKKLLSWNLRFNNHRHCCNRADWCWQNADWVIVPVWVVGHVR